MDKAIFDFPVQFSWKPVVSNAPRLSDESSGRTFVVLGMGGSHLAADIIADIRPNLPIFIHKDYGLPEHIPASQTLFIASSYSGNTEEVLDGAKAALERGLDIACIATGGALLEFAKENGLPYVEMPDTHIQPRAALGFSILAMAALIGDQGLIKELAKLDAVLLPLQDELSTKGKEIAEKISGKTPIIYASAKNAATAYIWKIKWNETGKIPAFCNVFPELNHNEMTGFDLGPKSRELSERFVTILLSDSEDDVRVGRRFDVLRDLYISRNVATLEIALEGAGRTERIFRSLLLADWTAYHTALMNGSDPEQVPMVEDFKAKIAVIHS